MSSTDNIPTLPTPQEIEREKDKMDLRPAIEFIEDNYGLFAKGRDTIMQRAPSEVARVWADGLQFPSQEKIREPQIHPEEAREILARMPELLIKLSKLKNVSYEYANQVIEPVYNPDGTMKTGNTVPFEDFGKNNEHPTRLLIGMTPNSGETTYQSALPNTVYENIDAARMYQLHVLMHEFFHTIELPIRNPELRQRIRLETDEQKFTLQDWWQQFEDLVDSKQEPYVSRYAEGYAQKLTANSKRTDYEAYTVALAEQICESFVAYQLGIISNDHGSTNFKESMPRTWILVDTLCRAKLITKDDKIDV